MLQRKIHQTHKFMHPAMKDKVKSTQFKEGEKYKIDGVRYEMSKKRKGKTFVVKLWIEVYLFGI